MFYVANKSRQSETSAYSNLYVFVCHSIFHSAKSNTISSTHLHEAHTSYIAVYSSNVLQCAIYQYSLLAILYCIAVVNIAIYRCTDILFHP